MGLKYIEQVKSVVLVLLILLSFSLTFAIWTYSPVIQSNEGTTVDIAIAEKKEMEDIIKPYRMIVSQKDGLKGTFNGQPIESVFINMKKWEIQKVELSSNKLSTDQINEFIKTPNRASFFFAADVPVEVLGTSLNFTEQVFPDAHFNRLIIDWNVETSDSLNIYFISTSQQKMYTATAKKVNKAGFTNRILKHTETMQVYNEIITDDKLSVYVSSTPENILSYTYSVKDINTDKFKDALFNNPNLVRSNPVSMNEQQFTDDSALMKVNFSTRSLNYVHPASENENPAKSVDLIQNSLNFVNEHNGWTDDYRYSRMNTENRQINYQLYFAGLPVFGREIYEISLKWGTDRVHQYMRPLYTLTAAVPLKTREVQLASGQSIYDFLSTATDTDTSTIDDVVIGYYLSRDETESQFNLEPSWYYVESGSWIRISPELLGGAKYGLE
ncbi:Two-component signal transduction system YycFG, regulatory protein YycH [Paenisporosarcina quisquiliarum]|uniref:Two-component system activity regulator YycH n=1 Tax=Psychrobacillus psychrodurans TaxID=126157 RepID=A0A9X3L9A1_9BACI|nr:two-component system activity regulator YycH [Psychrobacillus psychrodurans]MCZ8533737.1 two-component system activity regulator YycH [Psychrobacillus psychrodurans]SEN28554.1 Two-component signal transduction system YycFG, regulatory protein YycH [Paenisporosarcina quisquiliarum]